MNRINRKSFKVLLCLLFVGGLLLPVTVFAERSEEPVDPCASEKADEKAAKKKKVRAEARIIRIQTGTPRASGNSDTPQSWIDAVVRHHEAWGGTIEVLLECCEQNPGACP